MNEDKAAGVWDQAKGKVKEAFGDATGNEKVANEGAADQVKGHAKETWGDVKDTASHLTHSDSGYERDNFVDNDAPESNGGLRDKVTTGAANLKDSIKHGLDNLEDKSDRR